MMDLFGNDVSRERSAATVGASLHSSETSSNVVQSHVGPISVTLNAGKIEDHWRLLRPLILVVDREEDGWWIVSDDVFDAYGDAASRPEALRQYICALIDHFEFLIREAEQNPSAKRELDHARLYLEACPE
jgi:predicted RNase H-like HicB family nuclease